ncbi:MULTISPECIES: CocE/NonD family hydrolase [Microbulbifer]|uniref:CocE/NonD family hydrolase n=1 Tax=Microbulbifer TaxID=48073 RepID=UPI001E2CD806|nr:CocE/NonD family hydrolase [Microbulbifer sp. YPW16]UHQ54844.1 CocE/NonD family hydrolase [Microbulbifer sp. YPW16]
MKIIDPLPRPIREIELAWIPISDGIHLAARIWMPEDAESAPVPAILEFIPYRRRDNTRARDDIMHPWFAGNGYACVRVDIRGSGDSEGVLEDEYLQRELDDGVEIIRWIAQQDWCDGNIGMIGISWGGFNGLQIAALRPPELKAVVSVASTDDRYADDVHHMGGCLLGDNLSWASTMFAFNSLPPDPEMVGERWREMWFQRLRGSGLWLEKWLRHQRRDDYWQHGSVCEDWGAIQCPVMAVSGWADGYTNAVFRLLANLQVPRLGLVGPWSHKYPHQGVPGPAIGFLQECKRWWDQWLKGEETGIMGEPMLRAWMQEHQPPTTFYQERPGRWVGEPQWPSPNIGERILTLASPGTLEPQESEVGEAVMTIQSPLSVGLFAGKWCSYAATPDLPHDQREEDGGALVFDSTQLDGPLEILGSPVVELELAADRPVAMVAVRLSDVAPDDKVTRVTYGLLNLTHRDGSAEPTPLEPGKRYRVKVILNDIGHVFPDGNRLRVSISTSYFPLAWPAPVPVRLTIFTGTSRLVLPERPRRDTEDSEIVFLPPEGARPLATRTVQAGQHKWRVVRDLETDVSTLEVINDDGVIYIEPVGVEMQRKALEWYSYRGYDYSSPQGETLWEWGYRRNNWEVRTVTRTVLESTPSHFNIHAQLDAYEGQKRVFSENWDVEIPRDLV